MSEKSWTKTYIVWALFALVLSAVFFLAMWSASTSPKNLILATVVHVLVFQFMAYWMAKHRYGKRLDEQ